MKRICLFLLLITGSFNLMAQDVLYLSNGTKRSGIITSNQKDVLYFKQNDSAQIEKLKKADVLIIEDYKGNRHYYAPAAEQKNTQTVNVITNEAKKNMLTMQVFGALFGRVSFQYERLSKDLRFGLVVPFALTFNPFGTLYPSEDSTLTAPQGIGFITGLDLNYYIGKHENFQFFFGPRIRYGTDIMLGEIEGYTIQTQFGWKIGRPQARFVQHLSFGFGFIRAVSVAASPTVDPKQSYAWGSINYRIGLRW